MFRWYSLDSFMSIETSVAVAPPQRAAGSIDADALKVPFMSVV